jgi:trehalose-6-phosphate synthase
LEDIQKIVEEIQEAFGYGCIVLRHEFLNAEKRCALWSIANIFLNTAIIEGCCLTPFEFVTVKH